MSNDKKGSVSQIVKEQDKQTRNDNYNQYVKQITPKFNMWKNMVKAFLVGGIICTIGQFFINYYMSLGADMELAKLYNTLSLVFLSILLTGLGIYQKLAKFGGAGTLVPITGFANSVAAPAVEYKSEGQVFGIGCKIFTIAGPVILYGIFSSWVLGIIYYILKLLNIVK
ncbi:MAG: putative rane protein [Herbinix sp.]|jgi:stage V sporulation protein AC|nr:putative rane protein [Herbinix sp.]